MIWTTSSCCVDWKSASICLGIDGRVKKWIVYPHPYLRVQGELIPTLTISQVYKYLGVNISPQRQLLQIR